MKKRYEQRHADDPREAPGLARRKTKDRLRAEADRFRDTLIEWYGQEKGKD